MKKIILASTSPRRKMLFDQLGVMYEVVPSNFEENLKIKLPPQKLVEHLSQEKAKSVALKFNNAIVIAADTIVVFKNEILGKPKTEENARKMLRKLSGKVHLVITGFTIIDTSKNKIITSSEKTKVYVKKLSKEEIENYVKSKEPLDKAGGYGIQEKGAVLIEKIEGDFFNVVGLPVFALFEKLRKFNVKIF